MANKSAKPTAFSYIRFSSPEQAEGDSLRRQTELAATYCKRHGWELNTALTFRDLGVSAFRGKNALVGNLRVFLDAISRGIILPGSALIVENPDRISRQGIDEGYDLCKRILKAGVHIVSLSPERDFGPEAVKSLSKGALELQLILERAAEESELKSKRNGAAWKDKVMRARENGAVITRVLPAWVEERGGRLQLNPERAAVVKRIFDLAGNGYGVASIVKRLTAEGLDPWGRSGVWVRAYVAKILKDRRALGEHQPRGTGRKPDGPPIPGYFPAVVSEEQFYAARAGAAERKRKPGRISGHVNLFAGLLKNARDGDTFFETKLAESKGGQRTYLNTAGSEGRAKRESFPADVFEWGILKKLREIDPHEILNGDHGRDDVTELGKQFTAVEAELSEASAYMDANGFSPTIAKRITALEERQSALAAQLAEARQQAANPLSESWGESQGLIDALASAPDPVDSRLRLRSALRRIVDSIWVLIIPRGAVRLAAVQIWFAGEKRHRNYLIYHRRPWGSRWTVRKPGEKDCESAAWPTSAGPALDLRNPDHVRRLEKVLAAVDLTGKSPAVGDCEEMI